MREIRKQSQTNSQKFQRDTNPYSLTIFKGLSSKIIKQAWADFGIQCPSSSELLPCHVCIFHDFNIETSGCRSCRTDEENWYSRFFQRSRRRQHYRIPPEERADWYADHDGNEPGSPHKKSHVLDYKM